MSEEEGVGFSEGGPEGYSRWPEVGESVEVVGGEWFAEGAESGDPIE